MRKYCLCYLVLLKWIIVRGQFRIHGGQDVKLGDFTFAAYVAIQKNSTSRTLQECSGAILSAEWILTAATCFQPPVLRAMVLAGHPNVDSDEAQLRSVSQYVIHPNHTLTKHLYQYDLILLKLDKPLDMGTNLISVADIYSERWREGVVQICFTLGWGHKDAAEMKNHDLQYAATTARYYHCPCLTEKDQGKFICLEGREGHGPCFGDAGGPLVCGGKMVGVAHAVLLEDTCEGSEVCGLKNTVAYYTAICPVRKWLSIHVPKVPVQPIVCHESMKPKVCRPRRPRKECIRRKMSKNIGLRLTRQPIIVYLLLTFIVISTK